MGKGGSYIKWAIQVVVTQTFPRGTDIHCLQNDFLAAINTCLYFKQPLTIRVLHYFIDLVKWFLSFYQ